MLRKRSNENQREEISHSEIDISQVVDEADEQVKQAREIAQKIQQNGGKLTQQMIDERREMCGVEVPVSEREKTEIPTAPLALTLFIGGWLFEIGTVLISLTDVISDVLVAIQFFREGHALWAWLVLASLLVSSTIYTVYVVEMLIDKEGWCMSCVCFPGGRKCMRLYAYPIVFMFAQLFPIVKWFGEMVREAEGMDGTLPPTPEWALKIKGDTTAAAKEELEGDQKGRMVMEKLDAAWKRHMKTHFLFYVETVVEAIPQSIIQLLAISFLGQATGLQVFSMSLSLLSIVSKCYVVSKAFDIKVVVYKFMLAAHDLFSLFYIFSTLISRDGPQEVRLFANAENEGGVSISRMSYVWLCWLGVTAIWGGVCMFAFSAYWWVDYCFTGWFPKNRWNRLKHLFGGCMGLFIGIFLFIPVTIAASGVKLLWLVGVIVRMEPNDYSFPTYASLYRFLRGHSQGAEEYEHRVEYFFRRFTGSTVTGSNAKVTGHIDVSFDDLDGRWRRQHVSDEVVQIMERKPATAGNEGKKKKRSLPLNSLLRKQYLPRRGLENLKGKFMQLTCREKFALIGIFTTSILYVPLQIFTLLFPFISYLFYFGSQNNLQQLCFWSMIISLIFAAAVTPATYRYAQFLVHLDYGLNDMEWIKKKLPGWIADFHLPPHGQVLRKCVPSELLPRDLIDHCTAFLKPSHIDISMLSLAECQSLKLEWKETKRDGPEEPSATTVGESGEEMADRSENTRDRIGHSGLKLSELPEDMERMLQEENDETLAELERQSRQMSRMTQAID